MARKKVTIKEKRAEAEAATKVKKKKATAKTSAAKTSAAKTSAAKTSAAKTKTKTKTKTKRTRKKAPTEIRLKAFWGVFNQSLKRMALYEYSQRRQADKKAAELTEKGNSPHFVQLVKEVIEAE